MAKSVVSKKSKLEESYEKLLDDFPSAESHKLVRPENESLAQPGAFPVVASVVTYGAYEKPIWGC